MPNFEGGRRLDAKGLSYPYRLLNTIKKMESMSPREILLAAVDAQLTPETIDSWAEGRLRDA
ncbi:MAG TPA: hypothetical protein VJ574_02625 [Candidatus Bathyarchaeia archaeon]|nr:hypothetical protein [Candidatus Bathyarchaeia archaeon]